MLGGEREVIPVSRFWIVEDLKMSKRVEEDLGRSDREKRRREVERWNYISTLIITMVEHPSLLPQTLRHLHLTPSASAASAYL